MSLTDDDIGRIAKGIKEEGGLGSKLKKIATLGGPLKINKKFIKERMLGDGIGNIHKMTGGRLSKVYGKVPRHTDIFRGGR